MQYTFIIIIQVRVKFANLRNICSYWNNNNYTKIKSSKQYILIYFLCSKGTYVETVMLLLGCEYVNTQTPLPRDTQV